MSVPSPQDASQRFRKAAQQPQTAVESLGLQESSRLTVDIEAALVTLRNICKKGTLREHQQGILESIVETIDALNKWRHRVHHQLEILCIATTTAKQKQDTEERHLQQDVIEAVTAERGRSQQTIDDLTSNLQSLKHQIQDFLAKEAQCQSKVEGMQDELKERRESFHRMAAELNHAMCLRAETLLERDRLRTEHRQASLKARQLRDEMQAIRKKVTSKEEETRAEERLLEHRRKHVEAEAEKARERVERRDAAINKRLQELTEARDSLIDETEFLRHGLKPKQDDVSRMKVTIRDMKSRIEAIKEETSNFETRAIQTRLRLKEDEERHEHSVRELKAASSNCDSKAYNLRQLAKEKQQELVEAKRKRDAILTERDRQQRVADGLRRRVEEAQTDAKDKGEAVGGLLERAAALQFEIDRLEDEHQVVMMAERQKLEKYRQEMEAVSRRKEAAEAKRNQLQESINREEGDFKEANDTLVKDAESKESFVSMWKKEAPAMESSIKKLTAEIEAFTEELPRRRAELKGLEHGIRQEQAAAKARHAELQSAILRLEGELTAAEAPVTLLRHKVDENKGQLKREEEDLANVRLELENAMASLSSAVRERDAKQQPLAAAQKQSETLRKELAQAQAAIEAQRSELEQSLQSSRSALQQAVHEAELEENEIQRVEEQMIACRSMTARSQRRIQRLEAYLESADHGFRPSSAGPRARKDVPAEAAEEDKPSYDQDDDAVNHFHTEALRLAQQATQRADRVLSAFGLSSL